MNVCANCRNRYTSENVVAKPSETRRAPCFWSSMTSKELLVGHALFLAETGGQILPHKAEGNLADPWIAKTPAAYRESTLVGFLLQRITIQQRTRRIVDIERYRPATPLGADRTVEYPPPAYRCYGAARAAAP